MYAARALCVRSVMAQIVSWERKSFNSWTWWKWHKAAFFCISLHFHFQFLWLTMKETAAERHLSCDWMEVSWKSLCVVKEKKNCGKYLSMLHMTSSTMLCIALPSPSNIISDWVSSSFARVDSKYRFLFMLTKAYNGKIYVLSSY